MTSSHLARSPVHSMSTHALNMGATTPLLRPSSPHNQHLADAEQVMRSPSIWSDVQATSPVKDIHVPVSESLHILPEERMSIRRFARPNYEDDPMDENTFAPRSFLLQQKRPDTRPNDFVSQPHVHEVRDTGHVVVMDVPNVNAATQPCQAAPIVDDGIEPFALPDRASLEPVNLHSHKSTHTRSSSNDNGTVTDQPQHDDSNLEVSPGLEDSLHKNYEEETDKQHGLTSETSQGNSSRQPQHEDIQKDTQILPSSTQTAMDKASKDTSDEEQSIPECARPLAESPTLNMAPLNLGFAFKVQKTSQRRTKTSRKNDSNDSSSLLTPELPGNPLTEKDLLMLLMQRSTERNERTDQALKDCESLQIQHDEMQKENFDLQAQVEVTNVKLERVQDENLSMHDQLHAFMNKYQKIKNWAMEMNLEYAALRQQGQDNKAAFGDIIKEKQDLVGSISQLKQSQHHLQEVLATVRSIAVDSRTALFHMTTHLEGKNFELEACRAELFRESREKKKLELHVSTLTRHQAAFDKKSMLRDQNLTKILQTLTAQVASAESQSKDRTLEERTLQTVQTMSEKPSVTSDDVANISKSLNTLFENLGRIKTDLISSVHEKSDQVSKSMNIACSTAIDEVVQKIVPEMNKVADLEKIQVRLEERVDGRDLLCRTLETGKQSAETRAAELQTLNNRLACDVTQANQQHSTLEAKIIQGLEAKLSEISVRWVLASKATERTGAKLRVSQEEVGKLLQRLKQVEERSASSVGEAQTEAHTRREHEIGLLTSANIAREKEMAAQHAKEAKSWVLSMAQVHIDLDAERCQHERTKEQVQQYATERIQSELRATTAEQKVFQAKKQVDNLTQDLQNGNRDMHEMQVLTERLPILLAEIESKNAEIDSLQRQLAEYELVENQLSNSQAELVIVRREQADAEAHCRSLSEELGAVKLDRDRSKDALDQLQADFESVVNEAGELRQELKAARTELDTMHELNQKLAETQNSSQCLREQLATADQKVANIDHLQQCLDEKGGELERTKGMLETAQADIQRLPILLDEKERLTKRISSMEKDLENALKNTEKLEQLEESLRHKDETIAELQDKARRVLEITTQLHSAKEESRSKDVELMSLRDRVAKMEINAQELNQIRDEFREHVSEETYQDFFSQSTNLSLRTLILPNSQEQPGPHNDNNEIDQQITFETQQSQPIRRVADRSGGINPRLTLLQPSNQSQPSHSLDQTNSRQEIIPESQFEINAKGTNDEAPGSPAIELPLLHSSSSDLTDLSNIDDSYIVAIEDDVYGLPQSPPNMQKAKPRDLGRAQSVASQESMLLQATPGGRTIRRDMADSKASSSTAGRTAATAVQIPALAKPSPGRLRNESQGRRSTPFPDALPNQNNARPQPNSAVKRRCDPPPEIDTGIKRLKRTPANLQLRPIRGQTPVSVDPTKPTITATVSGLPSTLQTADNSASTSSLSKSQRKSKQSGRKPSKTERYTAQFTQASVVD